MPHTLFEWVGFSLRHAVWALGTEPGPLSPMLIVPGTGVLPEFHVTEGDIEAGYHHLRSRRDLARGGLDWTVLVVEATVRGRDAFKVEWTSDKGARDGMMLGLHVRDEGGRAHLGEVLLVVPDPAHGGRSAILQRLDQQQEDELFRGMQHHHETVEAMADGAIRRLAD